MSIIKNTLRWLLVKLYGVQVFGVENIEQAGKRVLIVPNHTSFLDALLLALFIPGDLTFAVNTFIAKNRLIKPFLSLAKIFPMDPANPLSIKSLIRFMKEDRHAVIFPEGRITVTGALMKIYDGPGLVADRADALVLPIRIDGAQYTPFSRLKGRVRLRWFPKIHLTILPAQTIKADESVRGRARRKYAGTRLSEIMTETMFATTDFRKTLFEALLDAKRIHGGSHYVVEDIQRHPLNYNKLITMAFAIGKVLQVRTEKYENVGVLLPSMVNTVAVMLGLHAYGRVPAMLNYTVGAQGMLSACETAAVKTVLTSRRFIKLAKLENAAKKLEACVNLVYLEDVAQNIGLAVKLKSWIGARFAEQVYRHNCKDTDPDQPAMILFTSGSEGTPKGVVLSHANLLANRAQLAARVDFTAQDIILNALPLFHSFGLTAGTLLPILSGMKTFFYPSPLHYRIVPEIAYDINATVMFGTNTFLSGYARFAHPYDFYSMRYVFAGAEKLQDETRRIWSEKFGVRIFEGYGATETSPVLSINTPMLNKPGSVGYFLPGIEHHLQKVTGVERGGRLFVRGPNIMLGYYLHDKPGTLVPPETDMGKGWYDTGDIVDLDRNGFITICGRAKRFAKIGGEMVSLSAVEGLAIQVWPDSQHAVVSIPDTVKGEQLVLVTTETDTQRSHLLKKAKADGIGEINVPKKIIYTKSISLLGTGKVDYNGVTDFVKQELA